MRGLSAAGIAAVLAALAFDGGGYFPHSWIWAGVVLAWLAALALVLRTRVVLSRLELWWIGGLAAVAAWTVLSAVWSDNPPQSVLDARRVLVYVALALVVAVALDRRAARSVPALVLLVVAVVLTAGLVRYLAFPAAERASFDALLVTWPLGYANGSGALAAIGLPLAVALAAHARAAWARAGAGGAVVLLAAVLVLASSRGGAIAAVLAVVTLVWLDPRRRGVLGACARLALPVAAALAVCFRAHLTSPTLTGTALAHGRIAVAAALAGAAAAAAGLVWSPPGERRRGAAPRGLGAVAGAAAALGALVAALPELGADSLLAKLVGAERAAYWQVAWHEAVGNPGLGSGAGTFGRYWVRERLHDQGALDTHNLYLESLAEIGVPGLLLVLATLAVPLAVVRRSIGTTRLGAAAAAGYVAFLVHVFVDWDWELPAAAAPGLVLGSALLVLGRRRSTVAVDGRRRAALVVLAVALGALAIAGARSHDLPSVTAPADRGEVALLGVR